MSNAFNILDKREIKPTIYVHPSTKTSSGLPTTTLNMNNHAGNYLITGALTATVLTTILSVSGEGYIDYIGCASVDAISRTLRLQILIDGVIVYDKVSGSITTASAGFFGVGSGGATGGNGSGSAFIHVSFNSSFTVKVASSLTEINKSFIKTVYTLV